MSGRLLLILLLALAIAGHFARRWFLRTPPEEVARSLRQAGLWALAAALILLVVTGRLDWLWALVAAILPFVQRFQALRRVAALFGVSKGDAATGSGAGRPGGSARRAEITTRFLRMQLESAGGGMDGEVLAGRFAGCGLAQLTLEQLLALLAECRSDAQSVALLEAYLDSVHGAVWREAAGTGGATGLANGAMSRDEAYQVLGLAAGAEKAQIIAAHRRLMQRLHPDRGGSTFLAAKINQAKAVLLGH